MANENNIPVLKKEEIKKRVGNKLVYLLISLFVTVLIILFFRSSLSKVTSIQITGAELVPIATIGQAVQVKAGDSYFFVSSSSIVHRVKALNTIESVKVTKRFPGLIHVDVKEYQRVAFQIDPDGSQEALLADGSAVSLKGLSIVIDKPILSNWKAGDPIKNKLCAVLAQIPSELLSDLSEIIPNPSPAYEDKIKIYTRSNFEVDTTVGFLLGYMPYLSNLISDTKDNSNTDSGILSLLDSPYGKPFDKDQKNATAAPTPAPTSFVKQTTKKTGTSTTTKHTLKPTLKPTIKPTINSTPKPVIKPKSKVTTDAAGQ